MNKRTWGPIIWNFIHVLSYKIKEECFKSQKQNILLILKLVFSNLPCPYCTSHATALFKSSNIKLIRDKASLIDFLFSFHNEVNRKLKKHQFSRDKMDDKYAPLSLQKCCFDLSRVYNSKHTNNLRFSMIYKGHKNVCVQIINLILDNKENYITN